MYIEIIKEVENINGKTMHPGIRSHFTNDYARQLIKDGFAKAIEDPENYQPYPETEKNEDDPQNESPENSTEEKEPEEVLNKPKKKAFKKRK